MQELKTINVSAELSKPQSESWKMALKWTVLLATHFRLELSEAELKIYCKAFERQSPGRIEAAMLRCLHECQRMPRIADIEERLPYETRPSVLNAPFAPIKDWVEPYSSTANLHYYENAEGYRRVVVEKIQPRA